MLFEILLSSIIVALISFVGILTFYLKHETLKKYTWILIALASGTLLAAAFFHLIPETFHEAGELAPIYILVGILTSYIIESGLHWHHCRGECKTKIKPMGYLISIGDGIHNFIDGIVLGAAYLADFNLGVITTIAIIAHEIPQEISDFGILIKAGYSKKRALIVNFFTASTIIVGSLVAYFFATSAETLIPLIGFAGGNFLYLALSDLVPELHEHNSTKRTITKFAVMLFGIALLYFISGMIPSH
jgi:zinc and cadmium transporter